MKNVISAIMLLTFLASSIVSCSRFFGNEPERNETATETSEQSTIATTLLGESTTEEPVITQSTSAPIFTTTTEPALSTTKRKTTTNKKTTTTKKTSQESKIEISASSVNAPAANTKVQRAWRVKSGGVTVEVHKLAYGAPEWRTFSKKYTKSMNYQQICNIAIITCPANRFRCKCAEQLLGREEGLVYDMARSAGALVAVNCEGYSGHWDTSVKEKRFITNGPVVRDGNIVQNSSGADNFYLIYKNGTWTDVEKVSGSNVNSLINNGLSFTLVPQQKVIWDGKNVLTGNMANESASQTRNRTMIGWIDSTHYVMAAGEFMRINEMVEVLLDYGVKKAFMLNGGNCSYMYLKGVGNVTGTISPKMKYQDKVNVLEQEFYGTNSLLGKGKAKPLGEACPAKDIVYVY
ncbi:MAG: phosphodiester glycosidase family protein [Clostridiales bacterium]|nr:phosphodiester glycosidase family protein [Clostridiales bacterium]